MPAKGWVPVANTTAQCRTLSWRAKGLLLDLLSYPDEYVVTFDRLVAMAKTAGDKDVEGREALRTAMQELERKGYLAHIRSRIANPKPGGQRWRTETVVSDDPDLVAKLGGTAFWDLQEAGPPDTGNPEEWYLSNNTGFNNTKAQQDEPGQHATTFAAAHVGQHAGSDLARRERALYDAADQLEPAALRRLLLAFESNRKMIYRKARNKALDHLNGIDRSIVRGPTGVREVDLLSYKYGLQHYAPKPDLPTWLTRFS